MTECGQVENALRCPKTMPFSFLESVAESLFDLRTTGDDRSASLESWAPASLGPLECITDHAFFFANDANSAVFAWNLLMMVHWLAGQMMKTELHIQMQRYARWEIGRCRVGRCMLRFFN